MSGTITPHAHTFASREIRRLSLLFIAIVVALVGAIVAAPAAQATSVSGGWESACAIKDDGTVWCWGTFDTGLGDGMSVKSASPIRVHGLAQATDVASGGDHHCARLANGTVWCWGANSNGQLGDGSTVEAPTPVQV